MAEIIPEILSPKDTKLTNNAKKLLNVFEEVYIKTSKNFNLPEGFDDVLLSFFALGLVSSETYLNTSQKVIQKNWNASKCPNCESSFDKYEPCNDGYYKRATSLNRCPYCGQKLEW